MFIDILDKKRKEILPRLKIFSSSFYLAGGTGLALQLGHRDSVDFDFFTSKKFDNAKLFETIKSQFANYKITKIQDESGALSIILSSKIKISFFYFSNKLIDKKVKTEYFDMASIRDIAAMKTWAIINRATSKDYIDLYFILKNFKITQVISDFKVKFPEVDENLALKSLVYFKDVIRERIRFRNGNNISFDEVKKYLTKEVKKLH